MTFKELARIALLGTENAVFPEALLAEIEKEGIDITKEPALVMAQSAALYSQVKKAGFVLAEFKGTLPEQATGEVTDQCSEKSVRHLHLILNGKYAAVFPEFLNYLLENGKKLPTESLPALMGRADINEWWSMIELAIGPKGKWLLEQHPEWRLRLAAPTNINWETASRPLRIQLLESLRLTDPAKARALLDQRWSKESHRDKVAFLKTLKVGIAAEDEPFLERAKTDRRKEVRKEAIALLARLSLSDYAERMFQRALETMYYEKGKWHFHLPDEPDEAALADGLLVLDKSWRGGPKAGYLGQVFSKIPPSRWELHFEASPMEILTIFDKTDWSEVLIKALALAALLHHDEKWIGALLTFWIEDEDAPLWEETYGAAIIEEAPPETVNALVLEALEKITGLPDEDTAVFQLLLANDAPWENELTKTILGRLQEWVAHTKVMEWDTLHYKQFLDMMALRSAPSLFNAMEKGWRTTAPLWYNWEKLVTDMLGTILFRREMMTTLAEGVETA